MIIDNIIAIKELEQTDIHWGAAPVPVEKKGDQPWVSVWTDLMGVFSQSKHPRKRWIILPIWPDEGNTLRVKFGMYPLNNKIAKDANWAGDSVGRNEAMQAISLAHGGVFTPGFWDATGPEDDAFNFIVEGTKTPKQALDDAAKLGQEQLDKAWATWDAIK